MSDQEKQHASNSPESSKIAETSAVHAEGAVPPTRKKRRRVVRPGGEKVLESEAVTSFRLVDNSPRETPKALSGNDASLLDNVPPHWGRQ